MSKQMMQSDAKFFTQKLAEYKKLIDADIKNYSKEVQKSTLQQFGAHSRVAADAYLEILNRGGKRIRGSLAMIGYEMCGGKNRDMILQAARAVEMIHSYILIIDDINDRSPTRRGGPTAHLSLAEYHKKHNYSDSSEHFGESIAMNAALLGNHAAQMLLTFLDVDPTLRSIAIGTINQGMVTTAHGQFNDIFNEVNGEVSERDVTNVMEWKTAYYTFLNPLTFGMVLAGAKIPATDAIREYSLSAGQAFQITDDILGTFGEEFDSGKSPLDDIREGKRTLLTIYALEHAGRADKNFLIQMLGNAHLSQTEFNRCKDILIETGALDYARSKADAYTQAAIKSLDKQATFWNEEGVRFLRGLAESLLNRKA